MAAQQPATAPVRKATQSDDIFSGTVTAASAESVTVLRKVPARADEIRQFVVDKDTRVEGKLRLNARVTVRFRADARGVVHALRIIVRAEAKNVSAGRGERPGATQ